jgi:hypothetical protein
MTLFTRTVFLDDTSILSRLDPGTWPERYGHIECRTSHERHHDLMRKVARALAAVERHKQTTPYSWANPLPLRMELCDTFIYKDHYNALRLLGYFGRSWRWNNWDEQHPEFDAFCCGVLDYICSPPELRMDPELRKMFSPKALAGLTTPLQWRSPNR